MSGNYFHSLENENCKGNRNETTISGPLVRWQRKTSSKPNGSLNISNTGNRLNSSSSNILLNTSERLTTSSLCTLKRGNESSRKTPSKTPKNSPGRDITPGRRTPGDRFIHSRVGNDFERSRFHLLKKTEENQNLSPSKRDYQRLLAENLNGIEEKHRILSYQNKAPAAPESHANNLKVLYSQSKTPNSSKKSVRHIPQVPERILDAPEMMNDYYLNLLDWSLTNHLAVALGSQIYLWNASNGEIRHLLELEGNEDYVASVRWVKEGNYLAIGSSTGDIELWDVENVKRLRILSGHSDRVGALSWNQYILSSGSRSGQIHHSDVRVPQHHVATLSGHSQEVCGLSWSPNGRLLASGGNDNILNIWSAKQGECYSDDAAPLYSFTQHQAAVKAVAWCPWQPNVLASGGGTADRNIRLWNCNNGSLLQSVDTKSQVCALIWSPEYKELVSSHGFANNEVTIWKYPTMVKVAELMGHTERVLHMALSPDGTTIVSAGADETLRLWKCFASDPTKKKTIVKTNTSNILRTRIR